MMTATQGKKMIHDNSLGSRLLDIEDAADAVSRCQNLLEVAREELNDNEYSDLAFTLLNAYQ